MLASIQIIKEIAPIEGADRIVRARVLGWDCIVRKEDGFASGGLCVYIEPDTIIPKRLLDSACETDEKVRLHTIKMKGQLSQGLVLPLSVLGWEGAIVVGQDVSEILGITKYEKAIPAHLQGIAEGQFPRFLRKTDEERIQSIPQYIDILWGKPYYITTKLDGTSATFYKFNDKFGVCSRNLELKDGANIYWQMAHKYNIDCWLPNGMCVQGEIIGDGIQENKLGLKDRELFLFNVFDINEQKPLPILSHNFPNGIQIVPLEERGQSFSYTLEELLEKAKGEYPNGELKEGIVVRSLDSAISFKVLNNDFLLKWKE